MENATQRSVLTEEERAVVTEALNALKAKPGALLPVLHFIQRKLSYVPPAAVSLIAQGLNLSNADVHGVIKLLSRVSPSSSGRPCYPNLPRRVVPVNGVTRAGKTRLLPFGHWLS